MIPANKLVPVVLVKNEEYWLPYCLESMSHQFERMVIYDVGSEDRTPEIIRWFVEKERTVTDFFVRYLPDAPPIVQGTFRNAMIAEARSPVYMILDGDEVYSQESIDQFQDCAEYLSVCHDHNRDVRYGLFRRIEVSPDLTKKYDVEREHHRLYTNDAIWMGTHPGEEAFYRQHNKSELDFRNRIACWHFHNTVRSSKEDQTHGRLRRKYQKSYHPGNLVDMNLFESLHILKKPIHDFAPCPALKELQNAV